MEIEKNKYTFLYILLCVVVSIGLPLLIQDELDSLVRIVFDTIGIYIEKPYRRIISSFLCLCITYLAGCFLLDLANAKLWLRIVHALLTFLWLLFIADIAYYGF